MFKKLWEVIKKHKFTTALAIITLLTVSFFVYLIYQQKGNEIKYEVQQVQKGNIEKVVSATGQMQDINQVDITPKATGEVTKVNVEVGAEVKSGDVLFIVDSTDLDQEISKARLALESAQIKINQMKEIDNLSVLRAENELGAAKNDLAELSLKHKQETEQAEADKDSAQTKLEELDEDDPLYQTYQDKLAEAERKIEAYKLNHPMEISEAEAKIKEKEESLNDIKAGSSSQDLRLQEIAIQEKQMALDNLVASREDYTVTAPNDGIIVALNVKAGDNLASSGSTSQNNESQATASIISNKMEAIVLINEVDILNIKKDQTAKLTFDAIENLELTGQVSKIDQLSTEDQGVVSHNVTITLDKQDERIKDGMTANVDITVAAKEDVISIPVSAVTAMGDRSAVQVVTDKVSIGRSGELTGVQTLMASVTTGISDDINIEISEGLSEGDIIVLNIIDPSDQSENNNSNSQNNQQRPGGSGMPFEGRAMGNFR